MKFSSFSFSCVTVLIFLSSLPLATSTACYLPNKQVSTIPNTKCNEAKEHSHCCRPGDWCLDNGLCFTKSMSLAQQGCTDPTWELGGCWRGCLEATSFIQIAPTGLWINYSAGIQTFCCDTRTFQSNSSQCLWFGALSEPFTVPFGRIITDRKTGSTEVWNSTNPWPVTERADNSTDVASVSASASALPSGSQVNQTPTPTTCPTTLPSTSRTALRTGLGTGLGIGIPLLLALTLASLLWRRERQRSAQTYTLNEHLRKQLSATEELLKRREVLGAYGLFEAQGQFEGQFEGQFDGRRMVELVEMPMPSPKEIGGRVFGGGR